MTFQGLDVSRALTFRTFQDAAFQGASVSGRGVFRDAAFQRAQRFRHDVSEGAISRACRHFRALRARAGTEAQLSQRRRFSGLKTFQGQRFQGHDVFRLAFQDAAFPGPPRAANVSGCQRFQGCNVSGRGVET
jgi:uncharacterized protein YjbI with pentapeptide repeats